ncbi:antirestriction protein ArdA [Roseibium algicola]|uniref:Antirestriction protein ArdA n=1 Tax=Roseibium algicola TaxID=2857014 RepID=A0ABN4WQW2_9HYPH|nr:antirestriction protein ArdA [Roseibium aggregatum]AQQ04125.1 antirestriction protein ArdA [Roseibium aggregatum]
MTYLFAQPYDISANGFYFESFEDYQAKAAKAVNHYGERVEEFEIQFIDGDEIYCELAKAYGINQANLKSYFSAVDELDEDEKKTVILAVGECGYDIERVLGHIGGMDLDIYYVSSMRELAEQFVEEGLFGEIPERLQYYLDYDAIARDLSVDYTETVIAGETLIYRCA